MIDQRRTRHLAAALVVFVLLAGMGLGQRSDAHAATTVVLVGQASNGAPAQRYNPASVTIQTGDTVRWDWFNGSHDVQSYDGSFSSGPIGGMTRSGDTYSRVFSTPGLYTYYCDVHAGPSDADPARIDERIAEGKMVGKVVVTASDTAGPATSNVLAAPNPTSGVSAVTLSATVTDSGSVVSNVAAAEYFIDGVGANGTGLPLLPIDGSFDSAIEQVSASVSTAGLALGDHTLHVHGRDAAGNWGPTAFVTLTVSPEPAGNETALILLLAGSLSNTTNPVDFGQVGLTGADQVLEASPFPWQASDGTGTSAGWNVSLTASDLTAPGGTIPVANLRIQQLQSKIVTVSGALPPATAVPSFVPLDTALPLKLLTAAPGTGMGTYAYTPDFRLTLPASVAPGDYSSSLVVSINAGP